jgi:hypothetical protein
MRTLPSTDAKLGRCRSAVDAPLCIICGAARATSGRPMPIKAGRASASDESIFFRDVQKEEHARRFSR